MAENKDPLEKLRKSIEDLRLMYIQRTKELEKDIADVRSFRSPYNTEAKIETLFDTTYKMRNDLDVLTHKFNATFREDKYLELFEDMELADLYSQSGLALKDVCDEFKVSMPQASNYAKGKIEDMTVRNKLGKYLRVKCIENKQRISQMGEKK